MTAAIQKKQADTMAGFTPTNLTEALSFAEMLSKSGLVPRALVGKPSDILVVLLTGREFGIAPMASMRLISAIDGKAVIGGEAYLAVVQANVDCEYFRCTLTTDKKATFVTKRKGGAEETLTWTIEQAAKAGLLGKDNWKRYPEAMLRWRCVSALAKMVFADKFAGVYVEDEAEEIGMTAAPKEVTVDTSTPTADVLAEKLKTKPAQLASATTINAAPSPKPTLVPTQSDAVKAAGGITSSEMEKVPPAPVAEEKPVAKVPEKAPIDPSKQLNFGPKKGALITSLTGPELLENIALGSAKIVELPDIDPKNMKGRVQTCIDALNAEQKRREAKLIEEPKKEREPGSDDDIE